MAAIRNYYDAGNTQTTYTTTYTFHPNFTSLVGSTLVIFFCYSNDNGLVSPMTCTDTQGNTWVRGIDVADTSSSGDERYTVYYCVNAAFSLTTTDTITIANPSTDYMEAVLFEVTGVSAYLDSEGVWQQNITGSTSNNLSFSLNCGSGTGAFVIAGSMNTLGNGSAPFYPSAGTGLTFGNNWFYYAAISQYTATWAYGTFASGSQVINFNSSAASSADNYVSFGIALQLAASSNSAALPWTQ
jgi:hypothetical protein